MHSDKYPKSAQTISALKDLSRLINKKKRNVRKAGLNWDKAYQPYS